MAQPDPSGIQSSERNDRPLVKRLAEWKRMGKLIGNGLIVPYTYKASGSLITCMTHDA